MSSIENVKQIPRIQSRVRRIALYGSSQAIMFQVDTPISPRVLRGPMLPITFNCLPIKPEK